MSSRRSDVGHGYPVPGPQCPAAKHIMDQVYFLNDEQWTRACEGNHYDIIVVGSGFCALAVVQRALQNDPGCRILLLERGTFFLPDHIQNLPGSFANFSSGVCATFPWTLSDDMARGRTGTIGWLHGYIPFFGGRSTVWSSWCPRPTEEEMHDWPQVTKDAARRYFQSAEILLNTHRTDEIDSRKPEDLLELISEFRPVFGCLQKIVQARLEKYGMVEGLYRWGAASLATKSHVGQGIDFQKFSVPGELFSIVNRQRILHNTGKGAPLDMVMECVVEEVYQEDGTVTHLKTSRGVLPIGKAKLVLAMGTLPPTTLVQNCFPQAVNVGKRFSAHFITVVVARVPKEDMKEKTTFNTMELGACYGAGILKDYTQQFHIQLSILSDRNPQLDAGKGLQYIPDIAATASQAQMESSKDHVVFVCGVVGELDSDNPRNSFEINADDYNVTTNSVLHVCQNERDTETWDAMDRATFAVLEEACSPKGSDNLEYWHGTPENGHWTNTRPPEEQRRVPGIVHDSSTLYIGEDASSPVDLNYKLRGTQNVFVTGGSLWPKGGSWNPTLTMVALAQHLADNLTM